MATNRSIADGEIELYGVEKTTSFKTAPHAKKWNIVICQLKILIEVVRSLEDVNAYEENENDVEADISKYISFCIVMLKTASLIADSIFDHDVSNCMFPEILKGNNG